MADFWYQPPPCKELGNLHFRPHHKKKAEQSKNQSGFLTSFRE